MRLLLVENDDRIAAPLTEGLSRYGYTVDRATTGATALAARTSGLVLLDLGLPDMDGLDVCRTLRSRSTVPIVVISALGEEDGPVAGLEVGADDYLVEPFGVRELVARLRAVTRRVRPGGPVRPADAAATSSAEHEPRRLPTATATATTDTARAADVQCLGPLTVDRWTRKASLDGLPLALSPKEFGVLACLAGDPGAVWFRRQILDEVWGPYFFGPERTLDVHVAALRRKLGDACWISSVHRAGYRLTAPSSGGTRTERSTASGYDCGE